MGTFAEVLKWIGGIIVAVLAPFVLVVLGALVVGCGIYDEFEWVMNGGMVLAALGGLDHQGRIRRQKQSAECGVVQETEEKAELSGDWQDYVIGQIRAKAQQAPTGPSLCGGGL